MGGLALSTLAVSLHTSANICCFFSHQRYRTLVCLSILIRVLVEGVSSCYRGRKTAAVQSAQFAGITLICASGGIGKTLPDLVHLAQVCERDDQADWLGSQDPGQP